jgi:hypothetical protein
MGTPYAPNEYERQMAKTGVQLTLGDAPLQEIAEAWVSTCRDFAEAFDRHSFKLPQATVAGSWVRVERGKGHRYHHSARRKELLRDIASLRAHIASIPRVEHERHIEKLQQAVRQTERELLAMRVLIAAMQSEGHDASSLLRYHNECDIRRFTLQEAVYELKGS